LFAKIAIRIHNKTYINLLSWFFPSHRYICFWSTRFLCNNYILYIN